MSTFVWNEVPSGLVNWSNATFTTLYEIDKVVDLLVGGVEYTDFTFSGNTLTLNTPPAAWQDISIDYFALIGEANTLQEIYERVYYILWEKTTSTTFDKNNYVIPYINELQCAIARRKVVNLLEGNKTVTAGDLRFLRKQLYISNVKDQKTTAAINVWDTTISVAADDFDTSGFVYINGNVIQYTGKTATTLTWVTQIQTAHESGSVVKQIYKVPSGASVPFQLQYVPRRWATYHNSQYFDRNGENFVEYIDFKNPKDLPQYYTIIGDDFTQDQQYVLIEGYNNTNDKFILHYYQDCNVLVNDTDRSILPKYYGVQVLAPLVAGELLYDTDEPVKAARILQKAYAKLKEMYEVYAEQVDEPRQKVRTRPFNNYYWYGYRRY